MTGHVPVIAHRGGPVPAYAPGMTCEHLDEQLRDESAIPTDPVCEDCMAAGGTWVHLRLCLSCGRMSCCDSSPSRHATAHFHATGHPVVTSLEPGETWRWCYVDEDAA
jgi:uncharacterized UBP type Zn finger protein